MDNFDSKRNYGDVSPSNHDLFLVMGSDEKKMDSQISPIYEVEEYYSECFFQKDCYISFKRNNSSPVPVKDQSNCGYTFIGKAKQYFKAYKALVAYGELSDDQEYVYINSNSQIQYVGESGNHKLYVRVYDNASGVKNDRWVVISII